MKTNYFAKFLLEMALVFCLFFAFENSFAQNRTAQIRQEMAKIRQTTNWDNPAEAKKAQEKIKVLMKELMGETSKNNPQFGGSSSPNSSTEGDSDNKDGQKMQEMTEAMNQHKMQVYEQIMEAAAAGEGADILLAEQQREAIVKAYEQDDDKSIKNADYLSNMTYLYLDLSMPGIDLVIDSMENFQNIKVLIITSKDIPSYTDIATILRNASKFPLEELYIINLKVFFANLPSEIYQFQNLKILELFQNNIKTVPNDISKFSKLETLMIDMNPIQSIDSQVNKLSHLKELGITKTQIPQSEVDAIKKSKPNLKITYP